MTFKERGGIGFNGDNKHLISPSREVGLGELRVRLDQMTERISSRFKDRTRFPLNEAIYVPDAVKIDGKTGISLLQFAIGGLEAYHASLGRFDYEDQHPVLGLNLPESAVERTVALPQLPETRINIGDSLITFYTYLVKKYCSAGDDPASYGETAYVDADLIQLMHERINLGRFVARVKGKADPSIYEALSDDVLLAKLRDESREEALMEKVREVALAYQFNPGMAVEAFGWMIFQTLDVEIAYIKQVKENERATSK